MIWIFPPPTANQALLPLCIAPRIMCFMPVTCAGIMDIMGEMDRRYHAVIQCDGSSQRAVTLTELWLCLGWEVTRSVVSRQALRDRPLRGQVRGHRDNSDNWRWMDGDWDLCVNCGHSFLSQVNGGATVQPVTHDSVTSSCRIKCFPILTSANIQKLSGNKQCQCL